MKEGELKTATLRCYRMTFFFPLRLPKIRQIVSDIIDNSRPTNPIKRTPPLNARKVEGNDIHHQIHKRLQCCIFRDNGGIGGHVCNTRISGMLPICCCKHSLPKPCAYLTSDQKRGPTCYQHNTQLFCEHPHLYTLLSFTHHSHLSPPVVTLYFCYCIKRKLQPLINTLPERLLVHNAIQQWQCFQGIHFHQNAAGVTGRILLHISRITASVAGMASGKDTSPMPSSGIRENIQPQLCGHTLQ